MDLVAVGAGPGSFTGLRIGIATAKALGAGLALELRAVSTLAALAHAAADTTAPGQTCLALIDGRRGEVFAALEGPGPGPAWGPLVCGPETLIERCEQLSPRPLAVGSGALRFRGELSASGIEVPPADHPVHRVAARDLCVIAAAGGGAAEIAPLYLRKPDAERWRERADLKRAGG